MSTKSCHFEYSIIKILISFNFFHNALLRYNYFNYSKLFLKLDISIEALIMYYNTNIKLQKKLIFELYCIAYKLRKA